MKNILITQTVLYSKKRGYIFSLSKDWYDYSNKIGFNLIPWDYKIIPSLLRKKKIHGIILSGGNDLFNNHKNKENKYRDMMEKKLLKYYLVKNIPILGTCRGFQLISSYFKSITKKCKNHVRKSHNLILAKSKFIDFKKLTVNSFHDFGVYDLSNNFDIISLHKDQSIEIAEHKSKKLLCLMFHPERHNKTQSKIDKFMKSFFNI